MSMVASMALFDALDHEQAPRPMAELVELDEGAFLRELYTRWNLGAYIWPRLHHLWLPFFQWTGNLLIAPDRVATERATIDAARSIGVLALRECLTDLVTDRHVCARCDVLGHILNPLHSRSQPGASTPAPTQPLVGPDRDASWAHQLHPTAVVEDPQAWSGTRAMHLIRGLHERGIDPNRLTWRLRATHPIAAATLATSCALWGLGTSAVIGTSTDESAWVRIAETDVRAAINRHLGLC
ncbi:hypothetical protein [Nocardiopsis sp. SBT366]|uniref:hypothetical protein n=1 Tax=Nocardiopsis sp. SBT366 TaxID=1580529 RepID=UPI001F2EAC95|nr:hypothetical protein [Nocardiopsis sp. SBT366]